jgi:DNA-binding Lrp family transcriptional regulator
LRDEGYIDRIVAVLDRDKLGLTLKAYMMVSLRSHVDDSTSAFDTLVGQSPEVLECSRVTGDADYLLKVVASDLKAFDDFVQTLLHSNIVASVRSSIVLRDVKRTTELPLPSK